MLSLSSERSARAGSGKDRKSAVINMTASVIDIAGVRNFFNFFLSKAKGNGSPQRRTGYRGRIFPFCLELYASKLLSQYHFLYQNENVI